MRYLGYFPSESDVIDRIIPDIEEDEPSNFVRIKAALFCFYLGRDLQ